MKAVDVISRPIPGTLIVLHLILPLQVEAQAQQDTIRINSGVFNVLTEEDVIARAFQYNRKLESIQRNLEIARYHDKYGNWLRNPELRVRDISTQYFTDKFEEYNIGLRFRFNDLGEISMRKQDARVEYWEARVREIRYRQKLIARVRRNFSDVIMYDRLADLARKKVEIENRRLATVERMVDLGQRSIVYFTKAKMWHAESINNLTRMQQRKRLERLNFAKLTGIEENDSLVISPEPKMEYTLEETIDLAYQNRPEIDLIKQRIELASRENRYEHLQLLPWFTFIDASYHKEKKSKNDWTEIRLGMTIPIINPNMANIKASRLAVQKKESQLEVIREQIEEEVRNAYTIYMDLLLDWQNFHDTAQTLIQEANTIIGEAHTHQTLMPDEIYELELTAIETQSLLEDKRNRLVRAYIDLVDIVGVEDL